MDLGDLDAAVVEQRKALAVYRKLEADGSVRPTFIAVFLNNFGVTLSRNGECREGAEILAEAVTWYEGFRGAQNASTANAKSHLGNCLTELGRFEEAEGVLVAALPVLTAQLLARPYLYSNEAAS